MKEAMMSYRLTALLLIVGIVFQVSAAQQEISLKTEMVKTKEGEAVHWMPGQIKVKQGDHLKFTVHHDLDAGFDFHGFFIPSLKIAKQVSRHKPLVVEVTIPKDMKPGEYDIGCQFHPKHVPAKLQVESALTETPKH